MSDLDDGIEELVRNADLSDAMVAALVRCILEMSKRIVQLEKSMEKVSIEIATTHRRRIG